MISFACKTIQIEEIVKCSFGLNKTKLNVLIFLLSQNAPLSVYEISEQMSLERTTVQKALKTLLLKKIVKRLQNNFSGGGYQFVYLIESKSNIKENMKLVVAKWHGAVNSEIEKW